MNMKLAIISLALLSSTMAQASISSVSTFEENRLAPESHWGGAGSAETGFSSGDAYFPTVSSDWVWSGYVYSNETNMTTGDYTNQYSAYLAGGENNTSGNQYAVSYPGSDSISLAGTGVSGMWVTNTTYAYLSMLKGDAYAKKFGGVSGTDADWFKLTATGITAQGDRTDSIDFMLADFTFTDNSQDYIIDTWTWFDLSSLGNIVGLEFSLSSSDNGLWGMNTPGYFAFDNFNGSEQVAPIVPEPATISLLAGGLAMLSRRMKK